MHRVRVRNRASVGATVARRAYSPAPICACVSTRQVIWRRDRTRQPVTTPQLVTPPKALNSEMSLTPLVPHALLASKRATNNAHVVQSLGTPASRG
ncbi:hypothetical protein EVAR_59775_1 [Eumeta japonica]|uniref:Uncharacterized protein n=1 Tax=Eumeta variegata TaxID=151549 RepID=A0A4C1ZH43_EUMVA|nr:hypothetical protein EVAR_59775_1 [Eumeta japonica]